MSLTQFVFGVTFVIALGSSIAMLFMRNAVHVALYLVAAQVALALAFLLQGAFFIAAVQIIVYAGAIMVLFLFVIMLLGVDRREALMEPLPGQRPLAVGLGGLLVAQIVYVAWQGVALIGGATANSAALESINNDPGNVIAIARVLFSRYLLPFEITSILLVVAIVGVMVLARRMTELGTAVADKATVEGEAA
ncbi:MAG TPA: NADH-quinone oxidoreductase subunit J [Actinomycetota bacterium]|nr:NADH-quinone oxidoreductase subunit J [Actinomycetota bacterium]